MMPAVTGREGNVDVSGRVLFIAGWGRSGSTLLDRLLGQTSGTVSVGELREVWGRGVLEDRLCGCGESFSACPFWISVGQKAFGGWDTAEASWMSSARPSLDRPWHVPLLLMPALARGAYRRRFDRYVQTLSALYAAVADVSGEQVVIDSSKIASHALMLRAACLSPRVLHLVRDSRGVMHSWRKSVQRPDSADEPDLMLRYGVVSGCLRYLYYNVMAHVVALVLPYRRIRYEDAVVSPGEAVRTALEQAGLPVDEPAITRLSSGEVDMTVTHSVDGNPMRFDIGSVSIRLDDAWRRELALPTQKLIMALTFPLLVRYGYLRGVRR